MKNEVFLKKFIFLFLFFGLFLPLISSSFFWKKPKDKDVLVILLKKGWNLVGTGKYQIALSQLKAQNLKCSLSKEPLIWSKKEEYEKRKNLHSLRGYWIFSEKKCKLKIKGKEGPQTIELSPGWNMISPREKKSFNEINIDCNPPFSHLWWYKGKGVYQKIKLDKPLKPGRGYWIWVPEKCKIGNPNVSPAPSQCPIEDAIPYEEQEKDENSNFDWRCRKWEGELVNWITEVKDQRPCGACWAFSIVAGMEFQLRKKFNNPYLEVDLSEQYLNFCAAPKIHPSAQPCSGKNLGIGLKAVKVIGIPTEECSPYEPQDEEGRFKTCQEVEETLFENCPHWQNELYTATSKKPGDIRWTIREIGPIVATIYNMPSPGGIDENGFLNCPLLKKGLHTVLVVGYHIDPKTPGPENSYWIAKNSWGKELPGKGYVKIRYNGDCQISFDAVIDKVCLPGDDSCLKAP